MSLIGDIFNTLLLAPLINLLVFLVRGFESLHIPGALGLAILVISVLTRLIVWPFVAAQLKSAKKITDLRPHLDELKTKHKDDKKAYAKAQMDLYKEHGVNPAGGCLPTLIQLPVLIALYQAIFAFFNGQSGLEHINNLLYDKSWHLSFPPNPNFLGFNLSQTPGQFTQFGVYLLVIPLLTALLTFVQSKMMAPKVVKQYPSDSPKEKKEKQSTEDAMAAVQGQMIFLMPIMIGYFSFQFPVGLSLYWNILTLVGILQQYMLSGWGGMEGIIARLPLKKS